MYKACLVALGYGYVSGVGVFNTFVPVKKSVTVRLLFTMNMDIHQVDALIAFCYANIEGNVYMALSPDFDLPADYCFKLEKSQYGLRSLPRLWWKYY